MQFDKKCQTPVRNKVLVAETVIVGEVPDSYVNVPENEILDAVN